MTHLNIQQGLNIEVVSTNLINKLYEAALSVPEPLEGELDAAYMSGNLLVDKWYLSRKQYLEDRFPDLHITVTDDYYIDFADSEVARICNELYGDGIGVTTSAAAAVTGALWSTFTGNTSITSFDEFKYFNFSLIQWTWSEPTGFAGCTNLTTIDFGNKPIYIGRACFQNCYSLKQIKNLNVPSFRGYESDYTFHNCVELESVNLSTVTQLGEHMFANCNKLDVSANGLDFSKITDTRLPSNCFYGTLGVGNVELPNVTSSSLSHMFYNCPSVTSLSNVSSSITDLGQYNNVWQASISRCPELELVDVSGSSATYVERMFIGEGCPKLKIVKLPSTLTEFRGGAIYGSQPGLEALVLNSATPPSTPNGGGGTLFEFTSQNFPKLKIYVPDNSINDYKTASGWSTYANIIYTHSQFAIDFPSV